MRCGIAQRMMEPSSPCRVVDSAVPAGEPGGGSHVRNGARPRVPLVCVHCEAGLCLPQAAGAVDRTGVLIMPQAVQSYIDWAWEYFRVGFHDVNAILGLLIAIVAAYFLSRYSRIFIVALGAVVFYVIAQVMLPVLANNAPFKLPPIVEGDYWQKLVAIYAGFLIVITVFYVVKRMVLKGGH
jgi:hypothetical protein